MSKRPKIDYNRAPGEPWVLVATREGGAPRFVVPRKFTAEFEAEFGRVTLSVEVDDGGVARCVGLDLRSDEISGGMLRQVPVAAWMREALERAANVLDRDPLASRERPRTSLVLTTGARLRRRGSPLSDEELQRVAGIYRDAQERGHAPTQSVADQLGAPRSTAARWVGKARARGYLGPAMKGRAGEAS